MNGMLSPARTTAMKPDTTRFVAGSPGKLKCNTCDAFAGLGLCGTGGGMSSENFVPAYVGDRAGSYIQDTTYQFVGEGAGAYDVEPETDSNRICLMMGVCGMISLMLAGMLGIALAKSRSTSGGTDGVGTTTHPLYDCLAGYNNWYNGWSPAKKSYCCELDHRPGSPGCNTKHDTTTARASFDCRVGVGGRLHHDWSLNKKVWCCVHRKVGCPTVSPIVQTPVAPLVQPPPPPTLAATPVYDCNPSLNNAVARWSDLKKTWCCTHVQHTGCPSSAAAQKIPLIKTSLPFDCNAGFVTWLMGWSEPKKNWCCQHVGRGCAVQQTTSVYNVPVVFKPPEHFECNKGFNNWLSGWSPAKKTWCCTHAKRGCLNVVPSTDAVAQHSTRPSSFDCGAGVADWHSGWPNFKKRWCCQHKRVGCPNPSAMPSNNVEGGLSAGSQAYDCDAGFKTWLIGWSPAKKAWCCDTTGKGCQR